MRKARCVGRKEGWHHGSPVPRRTGLFAVVGTPSPQSSPVEGEEGERRRGKKGITLTSILSRQGRGGKSPHLNLPPRGEEGNHLPRRGRGGKNRRRSSDGRDAGWSERGGADGAEAGVQRHTAVGRASPGQLPGRDEGLGRAAAREGEFLLYRRPARHHGAAGPRHAAAQDALGGGDAPGDRAEPGPVHAVHPEPREGARRGVLAAELHHARGLAGAYDPVQGQVDRGRARVDRPARLPRADDRRHHPLRRPRGAGGGRPEAARGAGGGTLPSGSTGSTARRSSCPRR